MAIDDLIGPTLLDLLADVAATFNAADQAAGRDARLIMLRAGERVEPQISTAGDECCSGLVWVRLAGYWPCSHDVFPTADSTAQPCDVARWALQIEIGSARCVPTPDENSMISAEEWGQIVMDVCDDAALLRRSLRRFQARDTDRLMYIERTESPTLEAECVSTAITINVAASSSQEV